MNFWIKTAPWQPTGELDLVVTFSRAVQDVKVLVGAPGEPQTSLTGQIVPEFGGCQCEWHGQLPAAGVALVALNISATNAVQGPGLEVGEIPEAPTPGTTKASTQIPKPSPAPILA